MESKHSEPKKRSHFLRWIICWGLLLATYMLFVDNLGFREWIAGAVSATIAMVALNVFHHADPINMRFRWIDLAQAYHIPWYLLHGTAQVLAAAAIRLLGQRPKPAGLFTVGYRDVDDDPVSAARRALAVTYTTATPNFVVVDVDCKHRLMLYHQIWAGEVLPMTRNLGAQ